MRRRWWLAVLALLAACAPAPPSSTAVPSQVTAAVGWTAAPLPAPDARVLVLLPVGNELLALGSLPGPDGHVPAAWATSDAQSWRALPLTSATGYGAQAELVMAAADGPRVAAYGQAFGGAHSNPRPTLWVGTTAGLVEHEQPFTLLGGEDAIATDAEAARGGTFLLAGAFDGASGRYGAAIWKSADGARWTRDADAPGLASASGEQTFARGATAAVDGFVLLGSSLGAGARTEPLAWTSSDGASWRRIALPSTDSATASAAACDAAGCTVLGNTASADQHVICWTLTGAQPGARADGPGHGLVEVGQALLMAGRVYVVSAVDRVAHLDTVGRDCSGWAPVELPVPSAVAALGPLGTRLVLATTDDAASKLWLR
jgi:hypothetical protein